MEKEPKLHHQSTRIISGTAYRKGLSGGLELISHLRSDPLKADSPETGLDLEEIANHSARATSITLAFATVAFVIWILVWLITRSFNMFSFILHLVGSALLCYEIFYLRWKNANAFLKQNYDPSYKPNALFLQPLSDFFQMQIMQRIIKPEPDQNVITFKGNNPFLGAGDKISGWTLSLERKPAQISDNGVMPFIHVPLDEFYRNIDNEVEHLGFPDVQKQTQLFVNGYELEPDGKILKTRESCPVPILSEEELWQQNSTDLADEKRVYRVYRYVDKARDSILSYFVRFYNMGGITFVETASYTLKSIDRTRYSLLAVLEESQRSRIIRFIGWTLMFAAILAFYGLIAFWYLFQFGTTVWSWRRDAKRQKRAAKMGEEFNYGLRKTFRESVAAPFYQSYFGVQDLTMYWKAIDETVLTSLIHTLRKHGVDTSKLEDQVSNIINNGVMVTGGEFSANQVAAGKGSSTIQQSGRVNRVVSSVTKAIN